MRRAGLILFHVAAALSLLLCVAAVGLWGWGRTGGLEVTRGTPQSMQTLDVCRGELSVRAYHPSNPPDPYPGSILGWTCTTYRDWDLLGLAPMFFPDARPPIAGFFAAHLQNANVQFTLILLPMWFVVSLFAILPLAAGVRHVRRRRRAGRLAAGCCIACGYDLRASPKGGRCPECGRASG